MAHAGGEQAEYPERKAEDRRGDERRAAKVPIDHADRRAAERRSGRDRRDR